MHLVIYDFTPYVSEMMQPLTLLSSVSLTHETIIDWILHNRTTIDISGYEHVTFDLLCDCCGVSQYDRTYVYNAFTYIENVLNSLFPQDGTLWKCSGFVDNLGYFVNGPASEELQIGQLQTAVNRSIQTLRGYHDSSLPYNGFR